MDRKVLFGLLAVGAAALAFSRGQRRRASLSGLGLAPEQHRIQRINAGVQAGFKVKDALKAARNGWCDSAVRALREAEYQAGQATAHAKSDDGADGARQRVKAQAVRVHVNRAAREVLQSCSIHRRRPPAGSARQGKLPF